MDQTFSVTGSMIYVIPLSLLTLVLASRIFHKVKLALFSELSKIPGPWYANWTNLWLKWHVIRGNRCHYIHALHLTYGHVVRITPTEVAISDLDACKTIHRAGSGFNKSEWYGKFNEGPPGIFAMTDPKQHATRRRLFAQAFSNSAIFNYESIVSEKVNQAVQKIKRDALAGDSDILKWFTFMATDVSGQLSFGSSFDMLQEEKKTPYIHDLEIALMKSGITVELGFIMRIVKLLPIPAIRNFLTVNERLDQYGHKAIQNLKLHANKDNASTKPTPTFFTRMLDQQEKSDMTDEEIEHEASNLIVAGSDTTAISLTYIIWALLRPINQTYKDNLVEELDASSSTSKSTPKELANLPYLNVVIKEGLRLYGAAPGSLPRIVPTGGALFGGYTIPAGITVSTQAYTIHRDPEIFPDPAKFKPDRWLTPTKEMTDAYTAFGAGSRTCIGIHLALLELQLGIAMFMASSSTTSGSSSEHATTIRKTMTPLLRNARISSSTRDEDMEFVNHFLIAPRGGRCEITLV